MKTCKEIIPVLGSVLLVLATASCDKFVQPDNEPTISTFEEDESHYNGYNCMDCHYAEGRGEGWFNVAGTVKGGNGTAQAELYIDTSQASILNVQVDKLGNFYTTEDVDFSHEYYVGVRSKSGNIRYMKSKIELGQCNLCHGTTTDEIVIDW